MSTRGVTRLLSVVALVAFVAALGWSTRAQPAQGTQGDRFEFQVIESFDAKYQGDTPGFTGLGGNLGGRRPFVGLGDPVHRGEEIVGHVTTVSWSKSRESLDVEFSPRGPARILVGETVWLRLGRPEGGAIAPAR